jgi:RNA polymerase sigma-70 factor (ECF subfamily)
MSFSAEAVSKERQQQQTTGGQGVGEATAVAVGAPPANAGPDDATLVVRAREGDPGAFEMLVRRYQRRIYQFALRMTASVGDAEDITQEVFLTAWRRLPTIRQEAAFTGWLFRTAANACFNLLQRRRPTSELIEDTAADTSDAQDPARAVVSSQQLVALTAALGRLTSEQRAVWLLREAHGQSYDEIARIVDTTPHAVRGRLSRARVQLAELMQSWR